jgi:hypothetical protein
MKHLIVLLFFVPFLSFSQDNVGITHYQRKCIDLDFIPGEPFSGKKLMIPYPDSLYTYGSINIKKVKLNNLLLKSYKLNFKTDTITNVEFVLKNKKAVQKYLDRLRTNNAAIPENTIELIEALQIAVGQSMVLLKVTGQGRGYRVKLENNL